MKYSTAPRPVAAPTATWLMRWVQPQALADSTGALTAQYTYDPYGQTSSSGSASVNSSSTPIEKMMARVSITIGHGITNQVLGVLSREIRLVLREG
ncbi:hypothetical protein ACVK1X_002550 [Pseudomonas sp. PvR086]|uniref:hypothetical protein n=2 Tax=unclassified Pseudomonas TaxID=196821 RepID=UPI0021600824|nr:hypothetical protein [Pseudomonas sp. B21-017]UVM40975.1 hypothetical protein LOY28_11440 [Pseudomonas sp. B21-017]